MDHYPDNLFRNAAIIWFLPSLNHLNPSLKFIANEIK